MYLHSTQVQSFVFIFSRLICYRMFAYKRKSTLLISKEKAIARFFQRQGEKRTTKNVPCHLLSEFPARCCRGVKTSSSCCSVVVLQNHCHSDKQQRIIIVTIICVFHFHHECQEVQPKSRCARNGGGPPQEEGVSSAEAPLRDVPVHARIVCHRHRDDRPAALRAQGMGPIPRQPARESRHDRNDGKIRNQTGLVRRSHLQRCPACITDCVRSCF